MKKWITLTEKTTEEFRQDVNGGKALIAAKKLKDEGNDFAARCILIGLGLKIKHIGQPYIFIENRRLVQEKYGYEKEIETIYAQIV